MTRAGKNMNLEVSKFLDELNHPFRKEIELLRQTILGAEDGLVENIKWNGPNYSFANEDRITMKIQPPKVVQLIFHRGAKVQAQPKNKLIDDHSGVLEWKGNDRSVATFKNMEDVKRDKLHLIDIVQQWIKATSKA